MPSYYTQEDYEKAKRADIIQFLNGIGYELVPAGRNYRGKLHDSLFIRENGKWHWNSKSESGNSPIQLYKLILMTDKGYAEKDALTTAVHELAGVSANITRDFKPKSPPAASSARRMPDIPIKLPERNENNNRAIAYLTKSRGIDKYFVDGLIKAGKLYESKGSHNCVFVAHDKKGAAQYAFMRGTLTDKPFKKDVELSDKSYAFTLLGNTEAEKVYVFESALDAISHANIQKNQGLDWRNGNRISLGGVSPNALKRYLQENPHIKKIVICLDNDGTGNRQSEKLMSEYGEKYVVTREISELKDFNEDLLRSKQQKKSLLGNLEQKKTDLQNRQKFVDNDMKKLTRDELE